MLRKKTGFKPKAKPTAVRRNAASDQTVADERLSKTPAPTPKTTVEGGAEPRECSSTCSPVPDLLRDPVPPTAQTETESAPVATIDPTGRREVKRQAVHDDNGRELDQGTGKQAPTMPEPKKVVAVPVTNPTIVREVVPSYDVTASSGARKESQDALITGSAVLRTAALSAVSNCHPSAAPRSSSSSALRNVSQTIKVTAREALSSTTASDPSLKSVNTQRTRRASNKTAQVAAGQSRPTGAARLSADGRATRDNRTDELPVEAANNSGSSVPPSAPKPTSGRKRKATAVAAEAATGASSQHEMDSRPRRTRQTGAQKIAPPPEDGSQGSEQPAGEGSKPAKGSSKGKNQTRKRRTALLPGEDGHQAATKKTRKRKSPASGEVRDHETGSQPRLAKKPRETTPEDAENVQVNITEVTMAQLAKDLHIGKKFSLHDELIGREKAKKRKRQLELMELGSSDEEDGQQGDESGSGQPGHGADTSAEREEQGEDEGEGPDTAHKPVRPAGQAAPAAEQYQIVDGQIVVNARSLQVDRHARAREAAGDMEEEEEDEFTNQVTQSTYLRRRTRPQKWTEEDTEQFYYWLARYGTSFDMLAELFPGKTRRHIKLKFNREEKANPERIHRTLVDPKTALMDMEEYMDQSGRQYETTEAIQAELEKEKDKFEAAEKAKEEERLEEQRKKRDELFGTGGDDAGRKGKKGKRKKDKRQDSGIITEVLEDD